VQVNRSPSFGTDEQLDYDIKSAVIEDAVRMLNIKYAKLFVAVTEKLKVLNAISSGKFILFCSQCTSFDALRLLGMGWQLM